MDSPLRVLTITCEWPTPDRPRTTHFIKRQVEHLRAAGVEVDVFVFKGGKRPTNYARAWGRIRPQLDPARYDLVHAQFGQSGLLGLPRVLPLVVTLRGSDLLGIIGPGERNTALGRIGQTVTRFVAARANAVIVVSEHMRAKLRTSRPVHVIPSGLDLSHFRPLPKAEARQHLGLDVNGRYVLFAGNPNLPRKRFRLARRAMDLLPEAIAAELVIAWGIPHDKMPYYMNACDAMVFTSMQEGSPNVVKEALACNLPVVSTPVGDVADRLAGVDGCELCTDERPDAIAAALGRALRRTARPSTRPSVEWLDERILTQQVIAIYRSVLRTTAASSWRGATRAGAEA